MEIILSHNSYLYTYLKEQWREMNSPKYQHYFDEWFNGLVESQIYWLTEEMKT